MNRTFYTDIIKLIPACDKREPFDLENLEIYRTLQNIPIACFNERTNSNALPLVKPIQNTII